MIIRRHLHLGPRSSWRWRLSTTLIVTGATVVETQNDQFIGRATCATFMIECDLANIDQATVVNFENLFGVLIATKNKVFVSECHSTGDVHFLSIKIERGRHLTRSVNQPGRVAFTSPLT